MARSRRGRPNKKEDIEEALEEAEGLVESVQEKGVEEALDDFIGEKIRDYAQKAAIRRFGNHPALFLLPEFIEAQKGYGPELRDPAEFEAFREAVFGKEYPTLDEVEELFENENSPLLEDVISDDLQEIDDIINELTEEDLEQINEQEELEVPKEELRETKEDKTTDKCVTLTIGFGDLRNTFSTCDNPTSKEPLGGNEDGFMNDKDFPEMPPFDDNDYITLTYYGAALTPGSNGNRSWSFASYYDVNLEKYLSDHPYAQYDPTPLPGYPRGFYYVTWASAVPNIILSNMLNYSEALQAYSHSRRDSISDKLAANLYIYILNDHLFPRDDPRKVYSRIYVLSVNGYNFQKFVNAVANLKPSTGGVYQTPPDWRYSPRALMSLDATVSHGVYRLDSIAAPLYQIVVSKPKGEKQKSSRRDKPKPKTINTVVENQEKMSNECCLATLSLTRKIALNTGAISDIKEQYPDDIKPQQTKEDYGFPFKVPKSWLEPDAKGEITVYNSKQLLLILGRLLAENHQALQANEILDKGVEYPNRWIAPRGKGKSKATNYLELFEVLGKMLDHLGIHPCEPTLADLDPANPGKQPWGIKTNNATHAIKLLLEYVKETDGDQAAALNLNLRESVLLGQMFIMISAIAESQLSLFQALGFEVEEEIDYIEGFPFDFTLGAEAAATSGKGFSAEAQAAAAQKMQKEYEKILKELASNDEQGAEAVLEKFLQTRKQPFIYNKLKATKSLLEMLNNVSSK